MEALVAHGVVAGRHQSLGAGWTHLGKWGSDSRVDDDEKCWLEERHSEGRPCGKGSSGSDVVSSYVVNDMSSEMSTKIYSFSAANKSSLTVC